MKARVILTRKCNRKCPDCPNNAVDFDSIKKTNLSNLLEYDELILTGGEPMLRGDKTLETVRQLRLHYKKPIYLYTAHFNVKNRKYFEEILELIDGITFTLHYNATAEEVIQLLELSDIIDNYGYWRGTGDFYSRLNIAENLCTDRFIGALKDFWDKVSELIYMEDCPVPEGEELVYLPIF